LLVVVTTYARTNAAKMVVVTGRLKSIDKDTILLETEEAKIRIPKKYFTTNAHVGDRIDVPVPKKHFGDLKVEPLGQ
jgi:hypothetical protein